MTSVGTLEVKFERVDQQAARGSLRSDADGFVQVRQRQTSLSQVTGEAQTRAWECRSRLATQAEYDDLLTAWRATKGGVRTLDWTPPDGASEVRVYMETFQSQPIGGRYVVAVTLREKIR